MLQTSSTLNQYHIAKYSPNTHQTLPFHHAQTLYFPQGYSKSHLSPTVSPPTYYNYDF